MDIGASIYKIFNYFFPETFPLPSPKTAEQVEEDANQACWEDIYSEPCARLSDLAEQKGGINVRKELMDLDARIRPLLNDFFAERELDGGFCAEIVETSCSAEPNSSLSETNYAPACYSLPELSCYEVLQCTEAPRDPSSASLHIYLMPDSSSRASQTTSPPIDL